MTCVSIRKHDAERERPIRGRRRTFWCDGQNRAVAAAAAAARRTVTGRKNRIRKQTGVKPSSDAEWGMLASGTRGTHGKRLREHAIRPGLEPCSRQKREAKITKQNGLTENNPRARRLMPSLTRDPVTLFALSPLPGRAHTTRNVPPKLFLF